MYENVRRPCRLGWTFITQFVVSPQRNPQQRSADFAAQLDQYKKASEYAETKAAEATQLSAQVEQLKKDTESAQALATSHATYSSQLSTQLEELKQTASAYAAAADASNGETALLRTQLAEAVAERQAMDERITQLASATAKVSHIFATHLMHKTQLASACSHHVTAQLRREAPRSAESLNDCW